MSTNDGGPAFPITEFRLLNAAGEAGINEDYPNEREKAYLAARNRAAMGMSLRDFFAAQALAGLCAYPHDRRDAEQLAKTAYRCADEMLKERETWK